jgi:hypothetical protein
VPVVPIGRSLIAMRGRSIVVNTSFFYASPPSLLSSIIANGLKLLCADAVYGRTQDVEPPKTAVIGVSTSHCSIHSSFQLVTRQFLKKSNP